MDDTSSNAIIVGVRLIRRRSQFSRRRLLSKNAAPFIHCLYLIYARKFDVRSHGKITQHWISTLTPIITNRTGLAEMRGPVLWLQHTSSTPDTSTRHPYVPTMLQGPLTSSDEYKTKAKTTKTMTVQNFSWLCPYHQLKLRANGRSQQCWELLRPCWQGVLMDATHLTLGTMCNPRACPQHYWKRLANGSNIVALRFGDHKTKDMLGVAGAKVWLVSNFVQQLPTTRKNM